MILRFLLVVLMSASVAACSLDASEERVIDPDEEFAKLDQPDVQGIEASLLKSAKAAEQQGNYGKALGFYEQLMGRDEENPDYMLGLAESLRRVNAPQEALVFYDGALEKKENWVLALEGKGLALMAVGEFPQAGSVLAEVMKQDAKRWRTLNALGVLFTLKEMYAEAQAYYDEALVHSPDNISVLNNMGLTQAINGQKASAYETLKYAAQAARMDERKRAQIELNLALVYGISGEEKKAEALASKHLEGPALHNNLGLYAHLARDDELAKSYLNMALSHSPTHYQRAWENLDYVVGQGKGAEKLSSGKAKRVKVK